MTRIFANKIRADDFDRLGMCQLAQRVLLFASIRVIRGQIDSNSVPETAQPVISPMQPNRNKHRLHLSCFLWQNLCRAGDCRRGPFSAVSPIHPTTSSPFHFCCEMGILNGRTTKPGKAARQLWQRMADFLELKVDLMNERWKSRLMRSGWTAIAGVISVGSATIAWAQNEAGGQNSGNLPSAPSCALDVVIFAALVGAAIFAICRSSRRS